MELKVINEQGQEAAKLQASDVLFGREFNEALVHQIVVAYQANARSGDRQQKDRSEVRHTTSKPWRQKGTGRARQGSSRSPHWRGGGVVFGPRVRSHAFKLNKKVRQLALVSALSRRAQEKALVVLDAFEVAEFKTRQVTDFMKRFDLSDMLLVADRDDRLEHSARNVPTVTTLPPEGLNVYDVLRRRNLVITRAAIDAVTTRLTAA